MPIEFPDEEKKPEHTLKQAEKGLWVFQSKLLLLEDFF